MQLLLNIIINARFWVDSIWPLCSSAVAAAAADDDDGDDSRKTSHPSVTWLYRISYDLHYGSAACGSTDILAAWPLALCPFAPKIIHASRWCKFIVFIIFGDCIYSSVGVHAERHTYTQTDRQTDPSAIPSLQSLRLAIEMSIVRCSY